MKKIFKVLIFILFLFNISYAFAGTIDHFIIDFNKKTAEVGEAVDITIKAVDKNDEVVTDYTGNILGLSQSDDQAELPSDLSNDSGYTFKLSDEGIKKFENGVVFNTDGQQTINVYDTSDYDNITGQGEITIVKRKQRTEKVDIEIITPVSQTTITEKKTKISGATKKNHQVQIEVNNEKKFDATSNTDGIFEREVELQKGKNLIKAYTLDADDNIIGESKEIIVIVDDNLPVFKSIKLSPVSESGSVEEGTMIDVSVYATPKLKTVKLLFNDGVIPLSETDNGIYTGNFKAPSENKVFPIDVVLANYLGKSVTKKEVTFLKVYLIEKQSAGDSDTGSELPEITCSGITDPKLLSITGLKVINLKTKSILTWDKNRNAESYDVYEKNEKTGKLEFLKNTKIPKVEFDITGDKIKYQYFAVRAKTTGCAVDNNGKITGEKKEYKGDLSDATKVKTGPEIIILLILSLLLGFIIIFRKRKIS